MADDKTGLLSTSRPTPPPQSPTPTSTSSASAKGSGTSPEAVYHDSSQSPNSRLVQVLFVSLVVVMIMITMCLSIYRGADADANRGTYLMLGVCLLGFAAIEVLLVLFSRRGDLPKGKTWFLYFVGFCIILESIFTNVLLFQ